MDRDVLPFNQFLDQIVSEDGEKQQDAICRYLERFHSLPDSECAQFVTQIIRTIKGYDVAPEQHKPLILLALKCGAYSIIARAVWHRTMPAAAFLASLSFIEEYFNDIRVDEAERIDAAGHIMAEHLNRFQELFDAKQYLHLYGWLKMCRISIMLGNESWNISERWLDRLPMILEAFNEIGAAKFEELATKDADFGIALKEFDGIEPAGIFARIQREWVLNMTLTASHTAGHLVQPTWETEDCFWKTLLPAMKNHVPEAPILMALLARPLPARSSSDNLLESRFIQLFPVSSKFGLSLEQTIEHVFKVILSPPSQEPFKGHSQLAVIAACLEFLADLSGPKGAKKFLSSFTIEITSTLKACIEKLSEEQLSTFVPLGFNISAPTTCLWSPIVSIGLLLSKMNVDIRLVIPDRLLKLLNPNTSIKVAGNNFFTKSLSRVALVPYSVALEIADPSANKALSGLFPLSASETSILFSNRSQCFIHMEKYPQALIDASVALELNPANEKAQARRAISSQRLAEVAAKQPRVDLDKLYGSLEYFNKIGGALHQSLPHKRTASFKTFVDQMLSYSLPAKAEQMCKYAYAIQGNMTHKDRTPVSIELWRSGGLMRIFDFWIERCLAANASTTSTERDAVMLLCTAWRLSMYGLPDGLFKRFSNEVGLRADKVCDAICNLFRQPQPMQAVHAMMAVKIFTEMRSPGLVNCQKWLVEVLPEMCEFVKRVETSFESMYHEVSFREPLFYDAQFGATSKDNLENRPNAFQDRQKMYWILTPMETLLYVNSFLYFEDQSGEGLALLRSKPDTAKMLIKYACGPNFFDQSVGGIPRIASEALSMLLRSPFTMKARNEQWEPSVKNLFAQLHIVNGFEPLRQHMISVLTGSIMNQLTDAVKTNKLKPGVLENFFVNLANIAHCFADAMSIQEVAKKFTVPTGLSPASAAHGLMRFSTAIIHRELSIFRSAPPSFEKTLFSILCMSWSFSTFEPVSYRDKKTCYACIAPVAVSTSLMAKRMGLEAEELPFWKQVIESADSAMNAHKMDIAIPQMSALVEFAIDKPQLRVELLSKRAVMYVAGLNRPDLALEDLQEAEKLAPKDVNVKKLILYAKKQKEAAESVPPPRPAAAAPEAADPNQPASVSTSSSGSQKKKKKKNKSNQSQNQQHQQSQASSSSSSPASKSDEEDQVSYSIICRACQQRECNMAAMCGHIWCSQCASKLKQCTFCGQPIGKLIKVFL
eukprot:TRINITY_DN4172_c0_g1_i1.p1 TRINITY_DN4172_c0_g1~~TRINITY_DN4172_c0_g1_i1.p1  ORF type:complete len:1226 (+),score=244.29 TRINITY_DN4172_c0_g1_i1:75-3752(+)